MKQQAGKRKKAKGSTNLHFPLLLGHHASPLLLLPLTFCLLIGLVACGGGGKNQTANKLAQDTSSAQDIKKSSLTFNKISLEQADEKGQLFWTVKAEQASYDKDKKVAQVKNPYGELYQDGKVVYQVTAEQGQVQQDGKQLFLEGKIVAIDPRNNIVLRGNELEWRPTEDLLVVRNQLTGTNKKLQAVAQEARVKTREQKMELLGQVVAKTTEPQLQLRTDHLIWQIKEEKLIADRPLQIDRYKNNTITDRATGNSGEVNLKTKIATLKQNALLALLEPPLQIASDSMTWNLNTENVTTNAPVRVLHRPSKVTVSADQGQLDIPQNIVYLTGNVQGIGQRRQTLNANKMTWYVPNQLVQAEGNIIYRQVQPPVTFKGQTASGNLENETIVVKGGSTNGGDGRVVTEIIP